MLRSDSIVFLPFLTVNPLVTDFLPDANSAETKHVGNVALANQANHML